MSHLRKRTRETEARANDERHRKKLKEGHKTKLAAPADSQEANGKHLPVDTIAKGSNPKHGNAEIEGTQSAAPHIHSEGIENLHDWNFSHIVGGTLADLAPLISDDEKHAMLAYSSVVNVYSISTHSVVATLDSGVLTPEQITGFCLSHAKKDHLYLATSKGLLQYWNWLTSTKVAEWRFQKPISHISAAKLPDYDSDVLFTADSNEDSWVLSTHLLRSGTDFKSTAIRTVRKLGDRVTKLCISNDGRHICYSHGTRFSYGRLKSKASTDLQELSYKWREFSCDGIITCLDLHISRPDNDLSQAAIVVGSKLGPLYVYRNLDSADDNGKFDSEFAGIVPLKLHWHRLPVKSVKWSVDGNYLISGGSETVLLIWQIDTGMKQTLPHLSSSIESLVVSKSGSMYGVRLNDNSSMILSTADLTPIFNIVNAQIPSPSILDSKDRLSSHRIPLESMGRNGEKLLIVCPTSSQKSAFVPRSQLQTVSLATGSQLVRQALARTNVTNRIEGPEGDRLLEPDISLLSLSHDEQWMATVDEWQSSTSHRDNDSRDIDEIFLKFWRYNNEGQDWSLVTRIDEPHVLQDMASRSDCKILDLISLHCSAGFLTFGRDRCLKLWRSAYRRKDGLDVLAKDGSATVTWQCSKSIHIPSSFTGLLKHARVVISQDDSMAVLGLSHASTDIIGVDLHRAVIKFVHAELNTSLCSDLMVSGRFLVMISQQITIWDLVEQLCVHSESLLVQDGQKFPFAQVAFNRRYNSLAVILSTAPREQLEQGREDQQILIYDLLGRKIVCRQPLSHRVYSIVGNKSKNAFTIVYCNGSLQRLEIRSPNHFASATAPTLSSQKMGLASLFEQRADKDLIVSGMGRERPDPAFAQKKSETNPLALTELLGPDAAGSYPSVSSMFERVARLYSMQSSA